MAFGTLLNVGQSEAVQGDNMQNQEPTIPTDVSLARENERVHIAPRISEDAFAVIDRMRAAFADVPTEELEREVAKAVAEVRAEMAAEWQARDQHT